MTLAVRRNSRICPPARGVSAARATSSSTHDTPNSCTPKNNSAMSNGVLTFIRILFANLETPNVRRLFLNSWCRCFQSTHPHLHCLQLLLQHGDLHVFVGRRLC